MRTFDIESIVWEMIDSFVNIGSDKAGRLKVQAPLAIRPYAGLTRIKQMPSLHCCLLALRAIMAWAVECVLVGAGPFEDFSKTFFMEGPRAAFAFPDTPVTVTKETHLLLSETNDQLYLEKLTV